MKNFSVHFKLTKDLALLKRLHLRAFPGEEARDFGQDKAWLIYLAKGKAQGRQKKLAGFCSLYITENRELFLSRTAIFERGIGLHRKAIKMREAWARRNFEKFDGWLVTYVLETNYSSMVNLIKCGYEIYLPDYNYAGKEFLYFRKNLK